MNKDIVNLTFYQSIVDKFILLGHFRSNTSYFVEIIGHFMIKL